MFQPGFRFSHIDETLGDLVMLALQSAHTRGNQHIKENPGQDISYDHDIDVHHRYKWQGNIHCKEGKRHCKYDPSGLSHCIAQCKELMMDMSFVRIERASAVTYSGEEHTEDIHHRYKDDRNGIYKEHLACQRFIFQEFIETAKLYCKECNYESHCQRPGISHKYLGLARFAEGVVKIEHKKHPYHRHCQHQIHTHFQIIEHQGIADTAQDAESGCKSVNSVNKVYWIDDEHDYDEKYGEPDECDYEDDVEFEYNNDESYKKGSDTYFYTSALALGNASFRYIDIDVANFDINGISSMQDSKWVQIDKEEDARWYGEHISTRLMNVYRTAPKKIRLYDTLHHHKWTFSRKLPSADWHGVCQRCWWIENNGTISSFCNILNIW